MALFKTRSAAIYGIDAHLIDVEAGSHLILRSLLIPLTYATIPCNSFPAKMDS